MISKKYGWETNLPENSHSYLLPEALNQLEKLNSKKILDIGAGNGALLPFWLKQNLEVSAMEPDEDGFNYCKQIEGVDVKKLAVGEEIPNEWKNNFDTIINLEVIEHLYNPHDLVKTCSAALNKNGYVIISTPYHGYLKNVLLSLVDKWDFHHHPNRVGGHVKFYSKKTICELFEKYNYSLVSFKGVGRFYKVWKSMVLVFKKND